MNIDLTFVVLLDALLKSAALLFAGSALIAIFRKASASNRHAILFAVLSSVLLLPFTSLISPRWAIALDAPLAIPAPTEFPRVGEMKVLEPALPPAGSAVVAPEPGPAGTPLSWKACLVAVWSAGAALFLARRLAISLKLRAIAQSSVPISDPRLAALADRMVRSSGLAVSARESANCRVPLVAGMIRPIVLLPADAREWDAARLSFALCHELGHVRRHDCFTRLVADIACALYWFNPLVWIAARQLRIAQEQACDDLVLKSGAPADEYAGLLVEAVRRLQSRDFTSKYALAMAQPSTLETRIVSILDASRNRDSRSGKVGAALGIFTAGILALCAAAQLRAAPEGLSLASTRLTPGEGRSAAELMHAEIIQISDQSPNLPPPLRQPAPPPLTPEQAKKRFGWIYEELEFRDATVQQIADQLTASSRKFDPTGKGATVRVALEGANSNVKVTLSVRNMPLIEVLAQVATRVQADVVIEEGNSYLLRLKPARHLPKGNDGSVPNQPSAAWDKAAGIMLPRVNFRQASVAQCADFLRARAKELDPEKHGVDMVLRPREAANGQSITLLLRDVPVSEALRYVAQLARLRIEADDSGITLSPLSN